jgi:hypothetical protein
LHVNYLVCNQSYKVERSGMWAGFCCEACCCHGTLSTSHENSSIMFILIDRARLWIF